MMLGKYFAHESSYVDKGAVIGEGTKIWHFSHVMIDGANWPELHSWPECSCCFRCDNGKQCKSPKQCFNI